MNWPPRLAELSNVQLHSKGILETTTRSTILLQKEVPCLQCLCYLAELKMRNWVRN